jgi:hypothetical protein
MSSVKNFIWVVRLYLNLLTKGVNDYVAAVLFKGKKTMRNADIARVIKERGSEIQYETLVHILTQSDRIVREFVQQGHSVLTECAQFTPRVNGTWIGETAKFDPDVHRVGLHIIPSAEMREALREVTVEVLGTKDAGAFIGLVTNGATGLVDNVLNTGDDIIIEGDKLRIAPEDTDGLGIFFVSASGEEFHVKRRLLQNDPKKLVARVPELPAGQYTLRVITRFSLGSQQLLKEPRVIEYGKPLVIN